MKIQNVLISDAVNEAAINILRERQIQCDLRPGLSREELILLIKDYDALIVRSGTQVTKEVIEAGHNLKLIGRAGVGVDNIDCKAATRAGIIVINAPGGNTISAVELTCTMILSCARSVPQACVSLKNGDWDRKNFVGNEVKDKTLAIIGLGRIGREVATRMQSFGMKTIGHDPFVPAEVSKEFDVESLPLEEIWPQADFITIHTPLIPQTINMINSTTFSKCKKGVKIINVARGGIINENDLLEALKSGQCGGAALDVFVQEPPENIELIKHPKVVCTPHLGASTIEAQNNVAKEIALQFLDIIDGKSVSGVVNAPLLSEMLKHQNLLWIRLGRNLGKLAATNSPSIVKSIRVTINGFEAVKVAKLIKETVLVGFLSIRTQAEVKLISASELASNLSINCELKIGNDKCCFSSVQVETDSGTKCIGIPQGRRVYLSEMNDKKFEPVVAMEGFVTFIQTKSGNYKDIFDELNQDSILSLTRAQNDPTIYAIHSKEKLPNLQQKLSDHLVFINQMEF